MYKILKTEKNKFKARHLIKFCKNKKAKNRTYSNRHKLPNQNTYSNRFKIKD